MALPIDVPELRSLDLLVSVARLGSLGRAAHEHGITQPAASLRMQQLERRLGIPLIDRSPTGSTLTPEGAVVVDWARRVLDAAAEFAEAVASLRVDRAHKVAVAASMTIAEYLVPSWLVALKEQRPELTLALAVGNSSDVAHRVADGLAEVGFVETPRAPKGLSCRVIARDRLALVVGQAHPWARRRRPVSGEELARTPLLQREAGSGTRETLELALAGCLVADPLLELSSTTAIKSAVASGVGPAVLSRLAVAEDVASGRLVEVPLESLDLVRPLRVVWPRGRQLIGPARDVVSVVARAGRRQGREP